MLPRYALHRIVNLLRHGAIIGYPTEGVYGIGCLPSHPESVERVLRLKARAPDKGLILLAASVRELAGWAAIDAADSLESKDESPPLTWIVPAGPEAYPLLTGGRDTIAVRISMHAVPRELSRLAGEPLISTSANLSGRAPIVNPLLMRRHFGELVDEIVPGRPGTAKGPSEIRDLATGKVIRAASANIST